MTFFFQPNTIRVENILPLPSFIMGVNGKPKANPSIIKASMHGSRGV